MVGRKLEGGSLDEELAKAREELVTEVPEVADIVEKTR